MKPLPRLLLVLAIPLLAGGIFVTFTKVRTAPIWTLLFPLGVILLGLHLIARLMQKEVDRFDEEERRRMARAQSRESSACPPSLASEPETSEGSNRNARQPFDTALKSTRPLR